MKVEPIHHVPMRPEYKSPFSAAFAIEGGRLIFFSGCCTVPTYHKHPHDPDDERQWLAGDFREQTERTFVHIKEILDAAGAKYSVHMLVGIPWEAISDYASAHQCDHIVMGTRGLASYTGGMLGSVALGVAQRSTVPVVLVK